MKISDHSQTISNCLIGHKWIVSIIAIRCWDKIKRFKVYKIIIYFYLVLPL